MLIGGKRFTAGEGLRIGSRCGSVVTMVKDGRIGVEIDRDHDCINILRMDGVDVMPV